MGSNIIVHGIDEFLKESRVQVRGKIRNELKQWTEDLTLEFLDLVRDQIMKAGNVDTGRLLKSFTKGEDDNIWIVKRGGLRIEIGTNVPYAMWVNSGHWTTSKGQASRWIPGNWVGGKFIYNANSDTGMLLKRKWIEGSHYWDKAFVIFNEMFDSDVTQKLDKWVKDFESKVGR